ncbi:hypothetical protein GCM10007028_12790 [Algibacter mikhailovii]|uniref:Uncharacterized protein n=1 Tax=Algibacter mikhailovii TaxID=425498 RepID=A0A918QZ93_9FLAO|nr:hypothetical protein GCM10007028_12790 [Algibacter mikhailovii]
MLLNKPKFKKNIERIINLQKTNFLSLKTSMNSNKNRSKGGLKKKLNSRNKQYKSNKSRKNPNATAIKAFVEF